MSKRINNTMMTPMEAIITLSNASCNNDCASSNLPWFKAHAAWLFSNNGVDWCLSDCSWNVKNASWTFSPFWNFKISFIFY